MSDEEDPWFRQRRQKEQSAMLFFLEAGFTGVVLLLPDRYDRTLTLPLDVADGHIAEAIAEHDELVLARLLGDTVLYAGEENTIYERYLADVDITAEVPWVISRRDRKPRLLYAIYVDAGMFRIRASDAREEEDEANDYTIKTLRRLLGML